MATTVSKNPIQFRVIIPKKLNVNGMQAPIRDACIKDAIAMGKDFEKVTKTWEGDKPRIQTEAKSGVPAFHDSFIASAWPRADNSKGYWKWYWLDEGTRIRYATMTKGFRAKTRKGFIGSVKGKGKMLFVNKQMPRPGIKGRKFTIAIRKKWEPLFKKHMATALEKARKASGHAM